MSGVEPKRKAIKFRTPLGNFHYDSLEKAEAAVEGMAKRVAQLRLEADKLDGMCDAMARQIEDQRVQRKAVIAAKTAIDREEKGS